MHRACCLRLDDVRRTHYRAGHRVVVVAERLRRTRWPSPSAIASSSGPARPPPGCVHTPLGRPPAGADSSEVASDSCLQPRRQPRRPAFAQPASSAVQRLAARRRRPPAHECSTGPAPCAPRRHRSVSGRNVGSRRAFARPPSPPASTGPDTTARTRRRRPGSGPRLRPTLQRPIGVPRGCQPRRKTAPPRNRVPAWPPDRARSTGRCAAVSARLSLVRMDRISPLGRAGAGAPRRPRGGRSGRRIGQHRTAAQLVEQPALAVDPAVQRPAARSRSCRTRSLSSRHVRAPRACRRRSGVEQRTSATWSSSGVSGSWPIALTTGVRAAETARHSASSLNGSRSSTLPPPRAITITSTFVSRSKVDSASRICGTAERALHGHVDPPGTATAGQRAVRVVQHVPLGRRRPPGDQPDALRQERQPAFAVAARTGLRRRAAGAAARSGPAARRCRPCGSRARRLSVPRPRKYAGRAWTTTLAPSRSGGSSARSRLDRAGHRHRHVRGRVAQGQERGAGARPGGDLGDLALHPDLTEPVDPLGDLAGDRADRPGLLRGGSWSAVSLTGERSWPTGAACPVRRASMAMNGGRSAWSRS